MGAMTVAPSRKARHPYIERKKGVCSGKPVIAGTRIKVAQIAIEYERLDRTPDQIVDAHPHLKLAEIHDALSYYYENQKELDADILADEQFVADLKRRYSSKFKTAYGA